MHWKCNSKENGSATVHYPTPYSTFKDFQYLDIQFEYVHGASQDLWDNARYTVLSPAIASVDPQFSELTSYKEEQLLIAAVVEYYTQVLPPKLPPALYNENTLWRDASGVARQRLESALKNENFDDWSEVHPDYLIRMRDRQFLTSESSAQESGRVPRSFPLVNKATVPKDGPNLANPAVGPEASSQVHTNVTSKVIDPKSSSSKHLSTSDLIYQAERRLFSFFFLCCVNSNPERGKEAPNHCLQGVWRIVSSKAGVDALLRSGMLQAIAAGRLEYEDLGNDIVPLEDRMIHAGNGDGYYGAYDWRIRKVLCPTRSYVLYVVKIDENGRRGTHGKRVNLGLDGLEELFVIGILMFLLKSQMAHIGMAQQRLKMAVESALKPVLQKSYIETNQAWAEAVTTAGTRYLKMKQQLLRVITPHELMISFSRNIAERKYSHAVDIVTLLRMDDGRLCSSCQRTIMFSYRKDINRPCADCLDHEGLAMKLKGLKGDLTSLIKKIDNIGFSISRPKGLRLRRVWDRALKTAAQVMWEMALNGRKILVGRMSLDTQLKLLQKGESGLVLSQLSDDNVTPGLMWAKDFKSLDLVRLGSGPYKRKNTETYYHQNNVLQSFSETQRMRSHIRDSSCCMESLRRLQDMLFLAGAAKVVSILHPEQCLGGITHVELNEAWVEMVHKAEDLILELQTKYRIREKVV